jgi:predicted permease
MTVRLALGASRGRLVRQLLTESLLLAVASAAAGLLFAAGAVRLLVDWLSREGEPVLRELSPDGMVLLFTVSAAVLTALVFGLVPAWRTARVTPHSVFLPGERGVAYGASRFNGGKVLVAGQLALSLVMIALGSLLFSSWRHLASVDPGFRSAGVLLVGVNARPSGLPEPQREAAFSTILERLRAMPGVTAASTALMTPIDSNTKNAVIDVPGFEMLEPERARVLVNNVSDQYWATIGTRLLRGRDFQTSDRPDTPPVAIVNSEVVRRFFGGRAAVGERFRFRGDTTDVEIIGVVEDVRDQSLRENAPPQIYLAARQTPALGATVTFALRSEQLTLIRQPVADLILGVHPRFALTTRTLQDQVDNSLRLPRTLGMLSAFFGALALLLAAVGLYGIMSYGVARRRNEIGVRVALGASQRVIVRMITNEMARMVTAGLIAGLLLSFAATRTVSAFLFGVQPNDPALMAFSALTLVAAAIVAVIPPARRAARLDPVTALRQE